VKIPTTELEEIGRKFDVGIDKLTSMDGKLDKLDVLVEGQEKMLKALEKIASNTG